MRHLRKFEELTYSTYMSAADKMTGYGQVKKAEESLAAVAKANDEPQATA
jgi:hypothetical protein